MEDKAYIEAAALLQILEISLKRGWVLFNIPHCAAYNIL